MAVDSNRVISIVITVFLVFVLMSALYPMIENASVDLKDTFTNSSNPYVKQYLPSLVEYAPFLFALAIVIGVILLVVKYLRE